MATATKKDKFFDVLKNIFIGAKIEGESGYVNLMRIKSKYYHEFKDQLLADIDSKLNEVGKFGRGIYTINSIPSLKSIFLKAVLFILATLLCRKKFMNEFTGTIRM